MKKFLVGVGFLFTASLVTLVSPIPGQITPPPSGGVTAKTCSASNFFSAVTSKGVFTCSAAGAGDVTGPGSAVSGHIAVFSGTSGKIIADGGAVPSGGSTRGLFAALPMASAVSGQTYFSTDAGLLSESDGSTWLHTYGNIFGVSPTTTSGSSTWFNENAGAAQATVANTSSGAGVILTSGSNSGYSAQARTRTYPATPFTYVICGQAALGTQFSEVGILATDGTKAVTFGVNMVGAAASTSQVQYGKATNATTFSAAYAPSPNFPTVINHSGLICFAESDNGSVRKVRYSFNKTDWLSAGFSDAITSTDFLTATAIGYYVNSGNSQGIVKYQIFSEEVVASALF